MRTCFIHVGTHKTGTTSVQSVLAERRDELQRLGFLYPRSGIPEPHFGHHSLSHDLYAGPASLSDCRYVSELLEELRDSQDHVIISAEGLGLAVHHQQKFAAFIGRLKHFCQRVVIIVYFRDQVSYAKSLYLTLLQHGYAELFEAFLASVLRDGMLCWEGMSFSFCYRGFLDLLPKEHEIEIVARSHSPDGSTVSDFLSVLGLTLRDLGLHCEPREHPTKPLAELLPFFLQSHGGFGEAAASKASAAAVLSRALADENFDMTGVNRQRIIQAFDQSNREVNASHKRCTLATSDTENTETSSGDHIYLEHLFSETTARIVTSFTNEIDTTQSVAMAERVALTAACHALTAERDQAISAGIARERELADTHAAALAERDHAISAGIVRERELAGTHAAALAERDAIAAALTAERDTILASRSWRYTAPLRAVYERWRQR